MTEKPVFTTEGLKDEEATLLGCLWARAAESTHEEAILHDPKAVELVESLDFDFDKIEKADYRPAEICIRATLVDSLVRRFLERHPDGTVVDIGAGLDTRFDRLDNGRVTWFELDLPNVIDLRRKFLDETPRRKFLSTSVMEEDWYETVREHGGTESILFVAEGVLYFVGEKNVRTLFQKLGRHFPGASIVFDSQSPLFVRYSHWRVRGFQKAKIQWSIANVRHIESWDERLKVEDNIQFGNTLAE